LRLVARTFVVPLHHSFPPPSYSVENMEAGSRSSWAVAVLLASTLATKSDACTIVAVGADASSTGSPIVSHTDDSGPDTTDVRFVRVPRQQWPKGSTRKFHAWADGYPRVVDAQIAPEYAPVGDQKPFEVLAEIPQVAETYAYWDMDYGVQNEWGVSIGESTGTAKTVGWPATADKPYGYCRAGIEDLSKVGLERCKTARCAVQTMGDVAVELGFYSADSGDPAAPSYSDTSEALVVGDSKELWIFNVMTGKNNASAIWAAQRVPSNHVLAVGNSFTIREMDFKDSDNFLFSPGVTNLAEEMGWWTPGTPFDFFAAYGYTPVPQPGQSAAQVEDLKNVLAFYSGRRMWRIFSLLSPEEGAKLDPNKGNLPHTKDPYPGSVPAPKGSVTPKMVMNVLRDHYEGTPYDLTVGMAAGPFGNPNRGPVAPRGTVGIWERAISMHRSSWSYVLEARPNNRSVSWLGLDSPHGTAYLPFFAASATPAPEPFWTSEGYMAKFSQKLAWWAFNMLDQFQDLNFQLINKDVRAKSAVIEEEGRRVVDRCISEADKAPTDKAARELLSSCSNEFAEKKVAEWWDFAFSCFAKFGRYTVTYNESEKGEQLQMFPSWWVHSPDVGYTLWNNDGPFHGVNVVAAPGSLATTVQGSSSTSLIAAFAASVSLVALIAYKAGSYTERRRSKDEDARQLGYVAV